MKENPSFWGRVSKLAGLFFCALALAAAAGCARSPAASDPAASIPAAASAPEFVTLPELTDEEISYKKFGESFQDYYEIEGQSVTFGTKGLYYTVNGVQVFDTVYDAGLEPSEYTNPYTEGWEEYFQNNSFLLVDVTAEYREAEAASPEAIPVSMPFFADYFSQNDRYAPFTPDAEDIYPELFYFSEHPRAGDLHPRTGEPLNPEEDYYLFRSAMTPGDTVDFQLGILAARELVEQKNVFLYLRFGKRPGEDPVCCVDLLGQ